MRGGKLGGKQLRQQQHLTASTANVARLRAIAREVGCATGNREQPSQGLTRRRRSTRPPLLAH